jgi:hypothetical protein
MYGLLRVMMLSCFVLVAYNAKESSAGTRPDSYQLYRFNESDSYYYYVLVYDGYIKIYLIEGDLYQQGNDISTSGHAKIQTDGKS